MKVPLSEEVSTWSQLCDQVEKAKKYLGLQTDEELWFRGITNRKHSLWPFLFRCFAGKKPKVEDVCSKENDLFFEFQAKARFTGGAALKMRPISIGNTLAHFIHLNATLGCPPNKATSPFMETICVPWTRWLQSSSSPSTSIHPP